MAQLLSHLETKAGSYLVSGLLKGQVRLAEAWAMWGLSGWDGRKRSGWAEGEGSSAKGQMGLVAHGHKPEAHAGLTASPGKYHHHTCGIFGQEHRNSDWLTTSQAAAL